MFPSNSTINSTACFTFSPVNDDITEDNEVFVFSAYPVNSLDEFLVDSSDFSITVNDDDGKNSATSYLVRNCRLELSWANTGFTVYMHV